MDNNTPENISEEKLTKEEILKNKFLERSFDKVISMLKSLSRTSPKDYVIICLLVVLILLNLLGPAADTSWKAGDKNMEKNIEKLATKVTNLEKRLQLLTPGETSGVGMEDNTGKDGKVTDETTPVPQKTTDSANENKPKITGKVKSYTIQSGDTLSVIIWKAYKSKDPSVIEALAEYNNLRAPDFDIYPGNTLNIPPLKELTDWHKSTKN